MSTRRLCALGEECLPALEMMEPRILLSADCVTLSPVDQPPPSTPAACVDLQAPESACLSVIREDVLDLASAVAARKAENPSADVSSPSIPGYPRISADGEIKVRIRFASDQADILAALTSGGFRAGSFHQSQGSTTGWVSYADLDALAGIPGVKEISFAMPPVTNSDPIISM